MSNPLITLFKNISDEDLKRAVKEMREAEETGIIQTDSIVRKYARLSGEITGGTTTTDFYMIQINLLKEAAYRWLQC